MKAMRKFLLALIALVGFAAGAQAQPFLFAGNPLDPLSGASSSTTVDETVLIIKYVGTTAGKPTVAAAAADSDLTFQIAGANDTTVTGCGGSAGVLDTANAACDTVAELVSVINATANWKAVVVSGLGSESTQNTLFTLAATDAAAPKGVPLFRDVTVALTAKVALTPPGADTDIRFWMNGNKIAPNPFTNYQTFVQYIREKITSTGTIGQFRILGVTPTYTAAGVYSDVVRTLYSETGAATTVEKTANFNSFPIVGAPGEKIIVDQTSGTDLTAVLLNGSAFGRKISP